MIACCLFGEVEDWQERLGQLSGYSDCLESPREGLVFLEVGEAQTKAVATSLHVSVGLASSQETAHLLALSARPGEVASDERRLATLPTSTLEQLELSPKTSERLKWLGVETLGQLRKWSKAQLSLYLGPESKTVIRYLHGPLRTKVARYRPAEILRTTFTFEEGVLEPMQLESALGLLCQQLVESLGDRAASRLALTAMHRGLAFRASRLSKEPLNQLGRLERLAHLALQDSGVLGLEVDKLWLELSGLYRHSAQGTLWRQRQEARKAVEVVERRFPGAMLRFDEINPYTPISSFRYRLLKVTGEVLDGPTTRRHRPKRPTRPDRSATHQLHP